MTTKTPTAPTGLSKPAQAIWRRLHAEYELGDAGAVEVLTAGLRAYDLAREADEVLAREGVTVRDRYGSPKSHPAADVATRARGQWLMALRALGLHREVSE